MNKSVLIAAGPALIALSAMLLWQNETGFDLYQAVAAATPVVEISDRQNGQLVAHSAPLKRDIDLATDYIGSVDSSFLVIKRYAEIYAWHLHRNGDGDEVWSLKWSAELQVNERNLAVAQELTSKTLTPESFFLGDLEINARGFNMPGTWENIVLSKSALSDEARARGMSVRSNMGNSYIHHEKNSHRQRTLGDERLSYKGFLVPPAPVFTYFGYLHSSSDTASGVLKGSIDPALIDTKQVVHHLAQGGHSEALAHMKSELRSKKWETRGFFTAGMIVGFFLLFRFWEGFFPYLILVRNGHLTLGAVTIGLSVSCLVIASGIFYSSPWLLLISIPLTGLVTGYVRWWKLRRREHLKKALEKRLGLTTLGGEECKERQFIEMARLATLDSKLEFIEYAELLRWARSQNWGEDQISRLLNEVKQIELTELELPEAKASEQHIRNLITLALVDNDLSRAEWRELLRRAKAIGYDSDSLQRMIKDFIMLMNPEITMPDIH